MAACIWLKIGWAAGFYGHSDKSWMDLSECGIRKRSFRFPLKGKVLQSNVLQAAPLGALAEGHCAGGTFWCRSRKLFNQSFLKKQLIA